MRITSISKPLACIVVALLFAFNSYSQTDSDRAEWRKTILESANTPKAAQNARIAKFNFAPMWIRLHDNASVLGYIGDNYQRMRIVILTATKQPGQPDTYKVTGKSMVKNVVRPFSGTMKITTLHVGPQPGTEEEYTGEKIKEVGLIVGEYHFAEDAKQTSTGTFDGTFATYWLVDRNGRLQYDEVMAGADGWLNNQFAGTWTSHRTKSNKPASWGDSRIPISGELDLGAGEFAPDEKYVSNGWQNYRDAYTRQNERAQAEERRHWWR
jgi:hypothetical protein